ncbi:hypothetical protein Tco_0252033, partial [Tanacetum coccineum]
LTRWAPNFNDTLDDNTDADDESVDSKFDDIHKEVFTEKASEIDEILETVFEEREQGELKSSYIKEDHKEVLEEVQSEDPFDIDLSLVWKSVRYGISKGLDAAYWGFLGVGTTFDIFQNIHIPYLQYGVLTSSGYGILSFIPLWSLVSAGMDTPYLP